MSVSDVTTPEATIGVKALSLWQPWASLVALGHKTIETRSWGTSYRGPLAIHATQHCEAIKLGSFVVEKDNPRGSAPAYIMREPISWPYRLPLGAVVATCELVDVLPIHEWGCKCKYDDGLYVLRWFSQFGEGAGLFESPGGAGVEHPQWSPSRLDCLDDAHPRQQPAYGDFRCGRYAWLLDDIKPIDPVPARGRQQLWTWHQ